jgi:hypothetical protein
MATIAQMTISGMLWTVVGVGASLAAAADLPKQGNYDFTSCWSGVSNTIAFSKTHTASSFELTGTNRSNPPGGIFDMTSFRCEGLNSTIEGKYTSNVICEGQDKDGDKWLVKNATEGTKGTSEALAGTGKYEGLVRTGGAESFGAFPTIKPGTFQGCNRGTGTYKLK